MTKLRITKESAVDKETIKVIVDGSCIARTAKRETIIDVTEDAKQLYLQGLFLKTNKVTLPNENGIYSLMWKQNYIFVITLVLLILFLAFKVLLVDDTYTSTDRIVMLLGGGIAIKVLWNDLLILGRKISIEK